MQLSQQQGQALTKVQAWRKTRHPIFKLGGAAGTGKSTIAAVAAEDAGKVIYVAPTGKAARVMREKGCSLAQTVHKAIYKPKGSKGSERLTALRQALENAKEEDTRKAIAAKIALEERTAGSPLFGLNSESAVQDANLVILDEGSMVDRRMLDDLMSFGVPVLMLGDPFQLPPVAGSSVMKMEELDFCLTEVHRQALDSPVLWIATEVREGRIPRPGTYGASEIRTGMTPDHALSADMLIVGRNATRRQFNGRMRELHGRAGEPSKGDKLICLKNSKKHPLVNGTGGVLTSFQRIDGRTAMVEVDTDDGPVSCVAHTQYFEGGQPEFFEMEEAESFDYGYAITAHKSQGSQANNVLVYNESSAFRQDAKRWLYTGITRAVDSVRIIHP